MYRSIRTLTLAPVALVLLGAATPLFAGNPNDPRPGVIKFWGTPPASVTEPQGNVGFLIIRADGGNGPVTVQYETVPLSATAGSDYIHVSGTLSWPDHNADLKDLFVSIFDDTIAEAGETFKLRLFNPTGGASLGTPNEVTVTITDGVPAVSLSVSPTSASEDSQPTSTFTVGLSTPATGNISVPFTLGGTATPYGTNIIGDPSLETASSHWWFNAENDWGTFTRTNEDSFIGDYCAKFFAEEMDGWLIPTYKLNMDIPPGGLNTALPYTLSFYARTAASRTLWVHISNSNSQHFMADFGNVAFTSTWKRYSYTFTPAHSGLPPTYYPNLRFAAFSDDLPLTLFIDGLKLEQGSAATKFGDYTASTTGSVSFTTGQQTRTVDISTIDDKLFESNETVVVSLGVPTGADRDEANKEKTFTITNDEDPPTASFSSSGSTKSEGEAASFTVALSHNNTEVNISVPFSYSGTAVRNSDYTAPNSISIAAGAISGTLEIDADEDGIDEDNETAIATIGTSSTVTPGSPAAATLTIVDEDPAPTVQLTASTATVNEDAQTIQVTAQLSGQSGKTVTVQYATASGTAASDEDFTLTAGTLTFNPGQTSRNFSVPVTIDCKTESSETFSVALGNPSNATLGATTSQAITVTDGTPCALLQVSGSPVEFPPHPLAPGPSRTIPLTLANIGNATLEFVGEGYEIVGDDAGDFHLRFYGEELGYAMGEFPLEYVAIGYPSTDPIQPSEETLVRILFNPTEAGAKNAVLRILTNSSAGSGIDEVLLSGVGGEQLQLLSVSGGAQPSCMFSYDSPVASMDFRDPFFRDFNWFVTEDPLPGWLRPTGGWTGQRGIILTNTFDGQDPTGFSFGYWTNEKVTACSPAVLAPVERNGTAARDLILRSTWTVGADSIESPANNKLIPTVRLRVNSPDNDYGTQLVLTPNQVAHPSPMAAGELYKWETFTRMDPAAIGSIETVEEQQKHFRHAIDQLGASGVVESGYSTALQAVSRETYEYSSLIQSFSQQPLGSWSFGGGVLQGWVFVTPPVPLFVAPNGAAEVEPGTSAGTNLFPRVQVRNLSDGQVGLAFFQKTLTGLQFDGGGIYRFSARLRTNSPRETVHGFRLRAFSTYDARYSYIQNFESHANRTTFMIGDDDTNYDDDGGPAKEYELIFRASDDLDGEEISLAVDFIANNPAARDPRGDLIIESCKLERLEPIASGLIDLLSIYEPPQASTRSVRPLLRSSRLSDQQEADNNIRRYVFEIARDADFTQLVDSPFTDVSSGRVKDAIPDLPGVPGIPGEVNCFPTRPLEPNTTYYVRLRLEDQFGQLAAVTTNQAVHQFTTGSIALEEHDFNSGISGLDSAIKDRVGSRTWTFRSPGDQQVTAERFYLPYSEEQLPYGGAFPVGAAESDIRLHVSKNPSGPWSKVEPLSSTYHYAFSSVEQAQDIFAEVDIVRSCSMAFAMGDASAATVMEREPGFDFRETSLASGLPGFVLGMRFWDDGNNEFGPGKETLFAWSKDGQVFAIVDGQVQQDPVLDIRPEVNSQQDRGLMGVALPPSYRPDSGLGDLSDVGQVRETSWVYLLYTLDPYWVLDPNDPRVNPECGQELEYDSVGPWGWARIRRVRTYYDPASGILAVPDDLDIYASLAERVTPTSSLVLLDHIPILQETHGVGTLAFGNDLSLLASIGDTAGYLHRDTGSIEAGAFWDLATSRTHQEGFPNLPAFLPFEDEGAFRAQDPRSLCGKILRLHPLTGDGITTGNKDFTSLGGGVVEENYYARQNQAGAFGEIDDDLINSLPSALDGEKERLRENVRRIWCLGLRNPYRFGVRPDTEDSVPGEIFIGDVGWNVWEEQNVSHSGGENFGWPLTEGPLCQNFKTANLADCSGTSPFVDDCPCPEDAERIRVDDPSNTYWQHRIADPVLHRLFEMPRPAFCDASNSFKPAFTVYGRGQGITRPAVAYRRDQHLYWSDPRFAGTENVKDCEFGTELSNSAMGGDFIPSSATQYPVSLRGRYILGDFNGGWIRVMDPSSLTSRPVDFATANPSLPTLDIETDEKTGNLYVLAYPNRLLQLRYRGTRPVASVRPHGSSERAGGFRKPVELTCGQASYDPEGKALSFDWSIVEVERIRYAAEGEANAGEFLGTSPLTNGVDLDFDSVFMPTDFRRGLVAGFDLESDSVLPHGLNVVGGGSEEFSYRIKVRAQVTSSTGESDETYYTLWTGTKNERLRPMFDYSADGTQILTSSRPAPDLWVVSYETLHETANVDPQDPHPIHFDLAVEAGSRMNQGTKSWVADLVHGRPGELDHTHYALQACSSALNGFDFLPTAHVVSQNEHVFVRLVPAAYTFESYPLNEFEPPSSLINPGQQAVYASQARTVLDILDSDYKTPRRDNSFGGLHFNRFDPANPYVVEGNITRLGRIVGSQREAMVTMIGLPEGVPPTMDNKSIHVSWGHAGNSGYVRISPDALPPPMTASELDSVVEENPVVEASINCLPDDNLVVYIEVFSDNSFVSPGGQRLTITFDEGVGCIP